MSEIDDLRAQLVAVTAERDALKDGPYAGRPIMSIDWWLAHPKLEYDHGDICAVGYDDLYDLKQQRDAARAAIDTLRRWMGEYPNDKYTGAWWATELDRILGKETP